MASTWTKERLPQFEAALRRLIKQHGELEGEPLYLAMAYLPRRNARTLDDEIFLFEVIGGIVERLDLPGDLMEATFESVPGLPTGFDLPLHLILANPREMEKALAEDWPLAAEIADAVRRGDYKILHEDAVGKKVLRQIRATRQAHQRAVGG